MQRSGATIVMLQSLSQREGMPQIAQLARRQLLSTPQAKGHCWYMWQVLWVFWLHRDIPSSVTGSKLIAMTMMSCAGILYHFLPLNGVG